MGTSSVNIGAASQGAWDVIAFTSDDVSVTLFTMDVSATSAAGTIGNAAGKTYLSAAQLSLLTVAAKQMVAFYGQAALAGSAALTEAAMRKVVGVINMDDGPINIGVAIVGTTATLSANPGGVPRRFAMYVPNAAGAGFFTGDGAGQESSPPVGPAGGVLDGTYPNPAFATNVLPYDMMVNLNYNATPLVGPFVFDAIVAGRNIQFDSNAANQRFYCFVAPTGNYVINVIRSVPGVPGPGTLFATITFAIGSTTGVWAWAGPDRAGGAGNLFSLIGGNDATFNGLIGTMKANVVVPFV